MKVEVIYNPKRILNFIRCKINERCAMRGEKKFPYILFLLCFLPFYSCLSGIDPFPDSAKSMLMSWSLPVGKGEFGISDSYYLGAPNINLTENVPEWAKHDTIYYSDSIAVDLSEIYNQSSAIKYLAFKTNIWNEFPAGGTVQMYFIDADGNRLYTFWSNGKFNIYKGDYYFLGSEIVKHSSFNHDEATLNASQIEQLKTAQLLVILTKVGLKDVVNKDAFQLFDNFKLICQVGVRVDFEINDI